MKKIWVLVIYFLCGTVLILGILFFSKRKDVYGQDALLVIDGKVIEEDNVKIYKKYAILPLIKTLENSGVIINWKSENTAQIVYNDEELTLDITARSLKEKTNGYELLQPALGSTQFYCDVKEKEIMLDSETLSVITNHFLGLRREYILDHQYNKVIVSDFIKTNDK